MSKKLILATVPFDEQGYPLVGLDILNMFKKDIGAKLPEGYSFEYVTADNLHVIGEDENVTGNIKSISGKELLKLVNIDNADKESI